MDTIIINPANLVLCAFFSLVKCVFNNNNNNTHHLNLFFLNVSPLILHKAPGLYTIQTALVIYPTIKTLLFLITLLCLFLVFFFLNSTSSIYCLNSVSSIYCFFLQPFFNLSYHLSYPCNFDFKLSFYPF
eukprot:GHVP01004316.1.p1 GENE.GHVP01004316.1~~GHVP01004316.1.p1  ORF type:complete len:130 (+),score=2.14 GHVP01004316.1:220-609(+)